LKQRRDVLFQKVPVAFVRFWGKEFKGDDGPLPGRPLRRVDVADELHSGRRIMGQVRG